MRILFLSHYFPPEGNAPAARTYDNCVRWVRAGHQVTVVTGVPSHPAGVVFPGYKNRLRQREAVDGIDVLRVATYLAANRGTTRRILNYLSYMLSATTFASGLARPDLVIATSPQFFCGWAGVLTSRLRRVPFVLEIRDLWPQSIAAVGALRNPRLLGLLERLERAMYRAAKHVVTVGQGYRRELLSRGVPDERLTVIPNGIDRARFAPRAPDLELKRSLGLDGRLVVGYSGTIGMASGLDVVLRAAVRLREGGRSDIAFLLVGDGAVREELTAEARRLGLERDVVFAGRQDPARMPAFLSICDVCLVHLRKVELFTTVLPSKIFEAAGMARPILIGVGGEAREIVERAGCGEYVEPENHAALVDAVLRLAADPPRRTALGEAGRAYVAQHHDRDRLAADYLALLERVRGVE